MLIKNKNFWDFKLRLQLIGWFYSYEIYIFEFSNKKLLNKVYSVRPEIQKSHVILRRRGFMAKNDFFLVFWYFGPCNITS